MSVAVLVDGLDTKNDKGETTYAPRTKEELDRIAALVRTAIGFDAKRGDQVEIVNLRFAEQPAAMPASEPAGLLGMIRFTKDDIMYAIELAVMTLLGIIVLFMVVRPLVRRVLSPERASAEASSQAPQQAAPGGAAQAASPAPGQRQLSATQSQTAQMIDVAQVQGQVHAQSVQRVGELAEKNPHETVAILRQWLSEPA
jgi:flagellar M-ring protein FliF